MSALENIDLFGPPGLELSNREHRFTPRPSAPPQKLTVAGVIGTDDLDGSCVVVLQDEIGNLYLQDGTEDVIDGIGEVSPNDVSLVPPGGDLEFIGHEDVFTFVDGPLIYGYVIAGKCYIFWRHCTSRVVYELLDDRAVPAIVRVELGVFFGKDTKYLNEVWNELPEQDAEDLRLHCNVLRESVYPWEGASIRRSEFQSFERILLDEINRTFDEAIGSPEVLTRLLILISGYGSFNRTWSDLFSGDRQRRARAHRSIFSVLSTLSSAWQNDKSTSLKCLHHLFDFLYLLCCWERIVAINSEALRLSHAPRWRDIVQSLSRDTLRRFLELSLNTPSKRLSVIWDLLADSEGLFGLSTSSSALPARFLGVGKILGSTESEDLKVFAAGSEYILQRSLIPVQIFNAMKSGNAWPRKEILFQKLALESQITARGSEFVQSILSVIFPFSGPSDAANVVMGASNSWALVIAPSADMSDFLNGVQVGRQVAQINDLLGIRRLTITTFSPKPDAEETFSSFLKYFCRNTYRAARIFEASLSQVSVRIPLPTEIRNSADAEAYRVGFVRKNRAFYSMLRKASKRMNAVLADEFNIDRIEPVVKIFVERADGSWGFFDPGDDSELETAEIYFLRDWQDNEGRASTAASSRLSKAVESLLEP